MYGAIQASRPRFNQKTISGLKKKKRKKKRGDYEELMEEGSNRKPKQLAFRGEMSTASEISPPEADTHTSGLCKVYKLDIFQANVTSIRWQKWVTETGHIITVTGQTQSCSCLQLLELY